MYTSTHLLSETLHKTNVSSGFAWAGTYNLQFVLVHSLCAMQGLPGEGVAALNCNIEAGDAEHAPKSKCPQCIPADNNCHCGCMSMVMGMSLPFKVAHTHAHAGHDLLGIAMRRLNGVLAAHAGAATICSMMCKNKHMCVHLKLFALSIAWPRSTGFIQCCLTPGGAGGGSQGDITQAVHSNDSTLRPTSARPGQPRPRQISINAQRRRHVWKPKDAARCVPSWTVHASMSNSSSQKLQFLACSDRVSLKTA